MSWPVSEIAYEVPWDELDPSLVGIVRLLNEFGPMIRTIGSCGGHEDGEPGGVHAAADEWWVTFELEPADPDAEVWVPSPEAWLELEFLSYAFNTSGLTAALGRRLDVSLSPYAPAPHMNDPGRMVRFEVRGYRGGDDGVEPDDVALALRNLFEELRPA